MPLRAIARLLVVLGRSVGFTVAALSTVLLVWWGYEVIVDYLLAYSAGPRWAEAGGILFMLALRLIAALWVMWSALKKDAVHLLLALLISGFVCFVFWWVGTSFSSVRVVISSATTTFGSWSASAICST